MTKDTKGSEGWLEFSKARQMNHPEMQQIEYYSIATATLYLTEIILPKALAGFFGNFRGYFQDTLAN